MVDRGHCLRDAFFHLGSHQRRRRLLPSSTKVLRMEPAEFAALVGVGALAGGFAGPVVGWLVDRAGVRLLMIGGALLIALCYVGLSRANSLGQFAVIFIVAGNRSGSKLLCAPA